MYGNNYLKNLLNIFNIKVHLFFSDILRIVPFGPEPEKLFATSGCKRLNQWITSKLYSN